MSSDFKGRWRRLAAAFAALAVGAATAIAFAPAATADAPGAMITLSKSSGLDPAADNMITVTGTGIDMTALGKRPPLSGKPGGVYVAVGAFADTWKPSDGAGGTARKLVSVEDGGQKWAVVSEDMATIGGANAGAIELNTDGSFSTTLKVSKADLDALVDATHPNIGVVTYPGSGATSTANETFTPITFADPDTSGENGGGGGTGTGNGDSGNGATTVQRSTSASVISATSSGASVRVSGAGYSATDLPNGVYAALYDASKGGPEQMNGSQSGIAMDWITGFSADGSWSTTLSASATALSAGGNYHVAVWPGHTDVSSSNILADIAVDLSGAAGGDTQGGTGTASAAVAEVDLAKDRAQTVTGTGFTAGETVTGTLHSDPVDLGTQIADKDGKVTFAFQIPVGFEVGKHTVVLKGATSGHSVTVAFTVTDSAKAPATTATAGSKPAAGAGATESASVLAESEICTEETVPGTAATPRLNWGVKSSFVAYLNTATAGGTITTAGGAAKAGDSFTWGTGSGSLGASGNGTVSFPGSIHITAHGGVLDLTISALKVTASGKTGTLTATIKSQDMQGNPVPVGSVVLADLSFSSLSATGGKATATLTAAGAKAFAGFYQAGEQLDPITVSFAGGSSATTKTVCRDADGNIISGGDAGLASTGVPVGQQLGVAVLLLLAGAGAVVLARRRREVQEGGHL